MTTAPATAVGRAVPWVQLTLALTAQLAESVLVATPAFLIPLLHSEQGLSLAEAGLLAGAASLGLVLTLVAWGAVADRRGERFTITTGLVLGFGAALGAAFASGYVWLGVFLVLGGMAAGSASSASGRLVVGWFPRERRGLAMGIRQMAQPLGTTVAAVAVPPLASAYGMRGAILLSVVLCGVLAIATAVGIRDPHRVSHAPGGRPLEANPYVGGGFLWRIHAVSLLLVVPQFALSTFGLVWLVSQLEWAPLAAGALVGGAQFVGALGRIVVGVWSDRIGRVRLLRRIAVAGIAILLLLGALAALRWPAAAAIAFVIATCVSVADNGPAFTSVAEFAGPAWAGRALGAQNTGQFLAAAAVGPGMGALIGLVGYPLAFALIALAPAAAWPLIPRRDREHGDAVA
ncbi:MFS transporter [Microbacterium sp. MEC084]|uniref:MFS transporter n=1 Tax=Microbacterium sp. MEC084 TaxID=1963027 RepID=UPI00107048D8|nr:MFS transporter [Microbacterium sp. MEC084]MCD1268112.1 MFS transporter [Microbacterium sp. MEC084]